MTFVFQCSAPMPNCLPCFNDNQFPGPADRLRRVHSLVDLCAHARPHDLHVHPAQRGGGVQPAPADHQHGQRVAAHQNVPHHRAGLGVQHGYR